MARNGVTVSTSVLFDGKQAQREMDQLKKRAQDVKESIEAMKISLGTGYQNDSSYKALVEDLKTVESLVKAGQGRIDSYTSALADMSNLQIRQLQAAVAQAKNLQRSLGSSSSQEDASKLSDAIDKIMDRINTLRKGFTDAMSSAQDTTGMTVRQMQDLIRVLQSEQSLVSTDAAAWDRYQSAIDNVANTIASITKEKQKAEAYSVIGNLGGSSESEIRKSIETLTNLRSGLAMGSTAWKNMGDDIQKAKDYLTQFDAAGKQNAMAQQFQQLATLSKSALDEQRKYWQGIADSAAPASQELANAQQRLESIIAMQKRAKEDSRNALLNTVNNMQFSGSIGETKDAIRELQEHRNNRNTGSIGEIKAIDDAIKILNENLERTSAEFMSVRQAMYKVGELRGGTFTGNIEELQKMKKALMEYKTTLAVTDVGGLAQVNSALHEIEVAENRVKNGVLDIDSVMRNLKTASLDELQAAARQLEEQLRASKRGTDAFVSTSSDLRKIKAQIDDATKAWETHDNVIMRTAKRLMSYVLVYAGFNEVISQTKQLVSANLELSDSLADIQKTTGLTVAQVSDLSKSIDEIDTRTAQKDLHDLAYQAGKLGISMQDDVLGFVKAGNQLLVALGEDLGGAESIKELMKINDVLGETSKLGIEKALLATGSAINEVGQSSTASEGYLVDFAKRLSGIAGQSNITMAQLIALGGTADALGQNVEVSATSLNKFIVTLQTSTRQVAQAAGVSEESLQSLLASGDTMKAIITVFEGLGKRGGMKEIAPLMGDLGSEGARMIQVLSALASNTSMLRSQLYTATQGFEQATSVTNEYNIKNENAAAILARMGNAIRENFVNSSFVGVLKDTLYYISQIPAWIDRNYAAFRVLISVLIGVTAQFFLMKNEWLNLTRIMTMSDWKSVGMSILAFARSLFSASTYTNLLTRAWRGLTAAFNGSGIGLIINAVATLASYFLVFKDGVKESTKAVDEFNTKLVQESLALYNLRAAIERANEGSDERASLIKKLNDNYGTYLNFIVSETNYAKNQEYIYLRINAALRENLALKMKDKLDDRMMDKYSGPLQGSLTDMREALEKIPGIGAQSAGEVIAVISNAVSDALRNGKNAVRSSWEALQNSQFKSVLPNLVPIETSLKNYINIQKNIAIESQTATKMLEGQAKASHKAIQEMDLGKLREMNKTILTTKDTEQMSNYISMAEKYMGTLKKSGTLYQTYADNVVKVKKRLEAANVANVWGVGGTVKTSSVSSLAATYKDMEDRIKALNVDADNYESQVKKYEETREEARAELARRGRNEKGTLLKESRSDSKMRAQAKREFEAVLSALEAYYNERETLIRERGLSENKTEDELNRNLEDLEKEHLGARIEMRKALLGKDNTLKSEYSGLMGSDMMKGVNVSHATKQLSQFGKTMSQGLEKQLTEDQVKLISRAWKLKVELKKILLENDPLAQVTEDFKNSFERLDLLFSAAERKAVANAGGKKGDIGKYGTEEMANERMAILKSLSDKAYSMNEESLARELAAQKDGNVWAENLDEEHLKVMLIQLRKFHDDILNADTTYNERKRKMLNRVWEQSDYGKGFSEAQTLLDEKEKDLNAEQSAGITTGMGEKKASLRATQLELDRAYYDARLSMIEQNADNEWAIGQLTAERDKKLAEDKQALNATIMETYRERMTSVQEYGKVFGEWIGVMASAEWNSVADRKKATQSIITDMLQRITKIASAKLTELIMSRMFESQKTQLESTESQNRQRIALQEAIVKAQLEGNSATVSVLTGIAAGTSKEVGTKGIAGLILGAVISAALMALLTVATSAISSKFGDAASSSSSKKLTTGMLTYADGDYPVLGNDGVVYNARYQKELKTGVYGGGAHFGIFSEKQPEMIVDGDTTKRIIMDYPYIYDAIKTISKHGNLKKAMPTYALGDYSAAEKYRSGMSNVTPTARGVSNDVLQLAMALSKSNEVNERLLEVLNSGQIVAQLNPYTNFKAQEKANNFMKKRGISND